RTVLRRVAPFSPVWPPGGQRLGGHGAGARRLQRGADFLLLWRHGSTVSALLAASELLRVIAPRARSSSCSHRVAVSGRVVPAFAVRDARQVEWREGLTPFPALRESPPWMTRHAAAVIVVS